MVDPNSIWFFGLKILKAKYFPNSSFLEVTLRGKQRYVWMSMLPRKQVMKEHIMCRIGDGQSTSIRTYPWLPDVDLFVQLELPSWSQHIKVASLMKEHGDWDEDFV